MTQSELESTLKSLGYPVEYSNFKKAQSLPFIVYYRIDETNISSDKKIHGKYINYKVELYTNKKDISLEHSVEAILEGIDSDYKTSEAYIESEKMYQIVYEIKVIERR